MDMYHLLIMTDSFSPGKKRMREEGERRREEPRTRRGRLRRGRASKRKRERRRREEMWRRWWKTHQE